MFGFVKDDDGSTRLKDQQSKRRIRLTRHARGGAVPLRIIEDVVIPKIVAFCQGLRLGWNLAVGRIDNDTVSGRRLECGRMWLDVPRRRSSLIIPVSFQLRLAVHGSRWSKRRLTSNRQRNQQKDGEPDQKTIAHSSYLGGFEGAAAPRSSGCRPPIGLPASSAA